MSEPRFEFVVLQDIHRATVDEGKGLRVCGHRVFRFEACTIPGKGVSRHAAKVM